MSDTPKTDAEGVRFGRLMIEWPKGKQKTTELIPADFARELERENQRFRNGFANLTKALQDGPGLPIELLDEADQAKWTDTITGILMALGVLEVTGKPMSPFEALMEAAKSE